MNPAMKSLIASAAMKALTLLAGSLATHGIITSSNTETFVSLGMLVGSVLWMLWDEYGRAIILSQLEVLKAKSLAQASAMRQARVPQVTVEQIADRAPDKFTPEVVAKVVETLPLSVQAGVSISGKGGL